MHLNRKLAPKQICDAIMEFLTELRDSKDYTFSFINEDYEKVSKFVRIWVALNIDIILDNDEEVEFE